MAVGPVGNSNPWEGWSQEQKNLFTNIVIEIGVDDPMKIVGDDYLADEESRDN